MNLLIEFSALVDFFFNLFPHLGVVVMAPISIGAICSISNINILYHTLCHAPGKKGARRALPLGSKPYISAKGSTVTFNRHLPTHKYTPATLERY